VIVLYLCFNSRYHRNIIIENVKEVPPITPTPTVVPILKPPEPQPTIVQKAVKEEIPVYIPTKVENLLPIIKEADETTQTDVERRGNLAMTSPTVIFFPPAYSGGNGDNGYNKNKEANVGGRRISVDTYSGN
jgi:hypothetical protein